jgi:hypothetical protein
VPSHRLGILMMFTIVVFVFAAAPPLCDRVCREARYFYDLGKNVTFESDPEECEFCVSGACLIANHPAKPGKCLQKFEDVNVKIYAKGSAACPKPAAMPFRVEGNPPTAPPVAQGTYPIRMICR